MPLLVFAVAAAGLALVLPNSVPAVAGVRVALVALAAVVHRFFDPRADADERAAVVTDGLGTLELTDAYVPPGDADEVRIRAGELDSSAPSLPAPRSELAGDDLAVRVAGSETMARVDGVADAPEFTTANRPRPSALPPRGR